jgi:hypothetical protein
MPNDAKGPLWRGETHAALRETLPAEQCSFGAGSQPLIRATVHSLGL